MKITTPSQRTSKRSGIPTMPCWSFISSAARPSAYLRQRLSNELSSVLRRLGAALAERAPAAVLACVVRETFRGEERTRAAFPLAGELGGLVTFKRFFMGLARIQIPQGRVHRSHAIEAGEGHHRVQLQLLFVRQVWLAGLEVDDADLTGLVGPVVRINLATQPQGLVG